MPDDVEVAVVQLGRPLEVGDGQVEAAATGGIAGGP
jgi:hypothetical protein